MGEGSGGDDRLRDLDARIRAARQAHDARERPQGGGEGAGSLAWRMVTELVVGVLVGGAIGWGIDSLFGTMPVFVIVMGLFGFAAGVKTMMRSAAEVERERAAREAGEGSAGAPPEDEAGGR